MDRERRNGEEVHMGEARKEKSVRVREYMVSFHPLSLVVSLASTYLDVTTCSETDVHCGGDLGGKALGTGGEIHQHQLPGHCTRNPPL